MMSARKPNYHRRESNHGQKLTELKRKAVIMILLKSILPALKLTKGRGDRKRMCDIIEKLGITPGPWKIGTVIMTQTTKLWSKKEIDRMEHLENKQIFANFHFRDAGGGRYRVASTENKIDATVISTTPEMLKVLIEILLEMEPYHRQGMENKGLYIKGIKAVQKATGKSWQKIKELL